MDTQVQNHTFYFGKSVYERNFGASPAGWEKGWDFRATIDTENETIMLEDTCDRMVPISFDTLWETIKTLHLVQDELVASLIGAPRAMP